MGSFPLAALSVHVPPPQPGPLEQYGRVMQLKSLAGQQQLQQQQLVGEQQQNELRALQLKDQQTLRSSAQGLDWSKPDTFGKWIQNAQQSGVSPQTLSQLALQRSQYQEQLAKTDQSTLAVEQTKANMLLGHIDAIKGVADPVKRAQVAQDQAQQILQLGLAKDPASLQMVQAIAQGQKVPTDDELKSFEIGLVDHKTQIEQQLNERKVSTEEKKANIEALSFASKQPGGTQENPEQKYIRLQAQGQLSSADQAWVAGYEKNKKMVPTAVFNMQGGALGDAALDQAAQRYLETGQLPAGMRSPAMSSKIMNRAGELGGGQNIAANTAAYKSNMASYQNVTKTLDTLSAFEQAGLKNLNQFTELAKNLPDTGVPWLNTPVRQLSRELVGDKNMPAIEAARGVALREIARVTSDPKLNGVLSDTARKEVSDFSPANATLPQILRVAEVLKQDMANVHSSMQAQKEDIGKRIGINNTASPNATAPTDQGGAKNAGAISPAVTKALSGVGPGKHTLSDGSVWMKAPDGSVTPAPRTP